MKQSARVAWIMCAALGACRSEPSPPEPKSPAPAPQAPASTPPKPDAKAAPSVAGASTVRAAYEDALAWIAAHQDPGGSWGATDDQPNNEVGMTGLALLALMSDGSSLSSGARAPAIARGVQWLLGRQAEDTGRIGEQIGHAFHYNHAIATQALCIALERSPSQQLSRAAQEAVDYISRARNPYGAWRYDYPPSGESDTSVTGWMVAALAAAKDAGLTVDEQAFAGATEWVDDVTDPASGRVGYNGQGTPSSRIVGVNDQYPTDRHEAMTASGMLTRFHAGQTPASHPILDQHAQLLMRHPPEYSADGYSVDEYYWYFGSLAARKAGGKSWERWRAAMESALLPSQIRSGEEKGSWKALGPWGYAGGTVFSTSLNALCLSTML